MQAVSRLDELQPALLRRLPMGADTTELMAALQQSAVRFCRESGAWCQDLPAIDSSASTVIYTVTNPWNADIAKIRRIGIRTAAEIAADSTDEGTEIDKLTYSYVPRTMTLKFTEAPATSAVTDALLVNAVLIPRLSSNEIAAWFLNLYRDGIVAGAARELCSGAGRLFNVAAARRGERDFNAEVARAVRDVETDWTDQTLVMTGGYQLL